MSNNIFRPELVEEAEKRWRNLRDEIGKNVEALVKFRSETAALPSQYVTHLTKSKEALEGLTNAQARAIVATEKTRQEQERTAREREKTTRATTKATKATKQLTLEEVKANEQRKQNAKQLRDEAKLLVRSQGMYNLIQQRVNKLTKQYNDLAAKKLLNNKLSLREEMALKQNETALNKYQGILKKIDADIGKHQRNVGNYRSSFDGLGFSMAQITREAPAFANSMQTGFMAISNNIPMLVDEITKLRTANKALAAEGKPTKNVLKSIGAALFSWQTLLSIGVTLLTVYGSEIVDWATGVTSAEKAQKKLNETMAEGNTAAIDASQSLRTYLDIVLDANQSDKVRNAALKELSETVVELKDVTLDQANAIETVTSLTDKYILATEARAKADAFARLAAELEAEMLKRKAKTLSEEINLVDRLLTAWSGINSETMASVRASKRRNEELEESQIVINKVNEAYREQLIEAMKLESGLKGLDRTKKELNKTRAKEVALMKDIVDYYERNDKAAKKFSDTIGQQGLKGLIEDLNSEIDNIKTISFDVDKDSFSFSDEELALLENQFNRLGELYGLDASKFSKLFDGKKNTVNDYVDAAAEAITGLYSMFSHNYDTDLERLERTYENQTRNAEEGTEARIRLDEQYQERKRQIERRAAQAEKDKALFEAIVNTASAVVAALPNVALAAVVGALGAAEIVAISSQPVPQFYDGTEDTGRGGNVDNRGGFNAVLHPHERVVSREDNNKMHGYSNKEVANIIDNYHKGSLFEVELNKMLSTNGILKEHSYYPIIKESKGLTPETFNKGINELKNTINGKQVGGINFDERGMEKYIIQGNTKKIIMNNRFNSRINRI